MLRTALPATGARNLASILAAMLLGVLLLPGMFGVDSSTVSLFTKMLIAAMFALGFNVLIGQGGMLSFGHAAYYGAGAFAALHAMRLAEAGYPIPTPLIPLAGGLGGLAVGIIAGYFATRRSGVYFSMITFAFAELLHGIAPNLGGVFGGESGLSATRKAWAGISFAREIHVYYLTLGWFVLVVLLLWLYGRTPLGRVTLALRENEQRLRFMGYDVHRTRTVIFAISAGVSGIAGGLLAVANESANYIVFAIDVSAAVVLGTFIGGTGIFFGPVLGASLLVGFAHIFSDLTRLWLLYQGFLFIAVMLFFPEGIGGLGARVAAAVKSDSRPTLLRRAMQIPAILGVLVAAIFMLELFGATFGADPGRGASAAAKVVKTAKIWGMNVEVLSLWTWLAPAAILAASLAVLRTALRAPPGRARNIA